MKKPKHALRSLLDPSRVVRDLDEAIRDDLYFQSNTCVPKEVQDESETVFRSAQSRAFGKKYRFLNVSDELRLAATDSFFANIHRIGGIDFDLFIPIPGTGKPSSWVGEVLFTARQLIEDILGDVTLGDMFLEARVSTGVTIGTRFTRVNLEDKFQYPITGTKSALNLLDIFFKVCKPFDDSVAQLNRFSTKPRYREVSSSRVTTVPKDDTKDRTIAIEPTANMFFQQGLMVLMYARLKSYGLDLSRLQQAHKELAYESSIHGRNATIDFSAASDSIGLALVEYLFPPNWFELMKRTRSDAVSFDGKDTVLPIYATMGNATTFPVETLIFYALARAVIARSHGQPFAVCKHKTVPSVFGDDCIIPVEYAVQFMDVCSQLGILVNVSKSFFSSRERFRESCGGDFFAGRNVRPMFVRNPLDTKALSLEAWLYVIFNASLKLYNQYDGLRNHLYTRFCDKWFLAFKKLGRPLATVPSNFPDDAGVKILDEFHSYQFFHLIPKRIGWLPVTQDKHGTYHFSYLRFRFKNDPVVQSMNYCDELRYVMKLLHFRRTKPTPVPYRLNCRDLALFFRGLDTPIDQRYVDRKFGYYVVAKSPTKKRRGSAKS